MLWNGQRGALIGIWWKLAVPSRDFCVSRYENRRPCSSGSLLKSMPGMTLEGMNATCSVSAKKLSTFRLSVRRPIRSTGRTSSGINLVASSTSYGCLAAKASSKICTPRSHSGKVAGVDRLVQVAPMEVGVGACDLDGLVPARGLQAQHRLPVKLDELALALGVDEAEAVHAEALHHAEAAGNRAIRHRPHDHVQRFRHQADEIPESVVRRRRLGIATVGFHLHAVNEIRKLDRILDEEHRDVVADQVPVPGVRVELDGKAAHVARRVD